ncbi:two-component system sensor histidine kinase DcuS [Anaerobacillus arseniciselenatis]|uniref:histidine kinase n=2 Tax=Anaerobacillus arseniciselenatis TaxID=85682 RepID=A0A1S2LAK2_9BACI|nr:DcuS/MalK family sensor histidine kinase [Anaerobacillus arseniciselenatis]OIJ09376.1 two-component system sensor histidine kinase DcuS [Anaerobacillus arseniciselenatis]
MFKMRTIIIWLVCIVVLMSLIITDLLVSRSINENSVNNEEAKALTVARIVAQSNIVQSGLEEENVEQVQVYANEVRQSAEVLFVVVMDMNRIRYSHPNSELVGLPFEGGDEDAVFQREEYSSISEGALTTSLRSFTPVINNDGEQIGAVAVGISIEHIQQIINQNHRNVIIGSLIGLLFGLIGALFIANYIKKTLYGLEPPHIAKMLEERNTMLQSVHEGIIAVDREGRITLVNKSAQKMFKKAGLPNNPIGMEVMSYLPMTGLDRVLKSGEMELGEEITINEISLIVNRVPLIVDNKVIGAISTLRDKTEVKEIAQQLSGVKLYVDALRAQSHEVKNNLHVILGMIRIGAYDQLKTFIHELVNHKDHEIGQVAEIQDAVLSGFLLGKLSYAKECGVNLTIRSTKKIPIAKSDDQIHELITILGNLINNSIEAVETSTFKRVEVILKLNENRLTVEVKDTGSGIKTEDLEEIFEKGFSTKGEGRGYGLALVKASIDNLNGNLTIDTFEGTGTTIIVEVPYEIKENFHD